MIENVFPTPLWCSFAKDETLKNVQDELGIVVQDVGTEYNLDWGKTHKISKLSDDIIKNYNLTNFNLFLNENLNQFLGQLNYTHSNDYRMESWISLFEHNDYGHVHDHGNADISGVYYFQTNQKDGNIVFENPTVQAAMSTCVTTGSWQHKPVVGKLLLFPGYLKHGIMRNESHNTRVSLSFNIFFNK
tara:strand:- start:5106 stop:5669 length:564 start_codon:yes stop_codon:yes gene_type:complete